MGPANLFENVSEAALQEIWNKYVDWKTRVEKTLPVEKRLFSTEMNAQAVWVIEDGAAFTLMYPSDY